MTLFVYIIFASTMVAIILTFFARIIATRSFSDREKSSPFECGFDPKNSARTAFSLRFFLLAVVFLVFDIEITFLLPLPMMITSTSTSMMYLSIPICLILLLGLLHEWHEGSLDWVN